MFADGLRRTVRTRSVGGQRGQDVALTCAGIGVGAAAGVAFAHSVQLGSAVVVGAALLMLAAARPVALGVIALVGVFAAQRLGSASVSLGASSGISYSDALLLAATVVAAPALFGRPEVRRLRLGFIGLAVYLACLLPTVFLNGSDHANFEWLHRLLLVGGSLMVGAWIAREGAVQTALRWLLVVSAAIAVLSMADAVRRGFQPAFPIGLNKNFVGALLGTVMVVVLVAAKHLALDTKVRLGAAVVIAGGLLASQSRGGMLAAAAGLLLAFVLDPRAHSRQVNAFVLVVTVVFAGFVYYSVRTELGQTKADVNNSSIGVRRNVERVTRDIWRTSPVDGVGLKYFTTNSFGPLAHPANNAIDNELAESGVIGLAGFIALQACMAAAGFRRRREDTIMIAGLAAVVGTLLHGMVDIYWTAGTVTLPFLIFGMALGRAPTPDQLGNTMPSTRSRTRAHS